MDADPWPDDCEVPLWREAIVRMEPLGDLVDDLSGMVIGLSRDSLHTM